MGYKKAKLFVVIVDPRVNDYRKQFGLLWVSETSSCPFHLFEQHIVAIMPTTGATQ